MPYTKTGFVRVPRSRYVPQMANLILRSFGETFDSDVSDAILSLGKERELLKNFFFERALLLKSPKLDNNRELKFAFMVLLLDFLHMLGYVDIAPVYIDYRRDPVMPADELLDIMLGTRLPTYTAADLGGEWASIDTLRVFFPEVIRRTALITVEKPLMAQRYRQWLGNIGFKLLTTSHSQLSQAERSFLTIHGCTKPRTKGFITGLPTTPIPPVENKDPMVVEIGALAVASSLPGPCINHQKLVSNGILEQLVFYYGPHVADLKSQVGYMRRMGPFMVFDVTPEDSISWLLDTQITGISSMAANLTVKPDNQPPFTLRVPLPLWFSQEDEGGLVCLYPDLPSYNLYLTDQRDISRFIWDYPSTWMGRRVSSLTDGGTMDYAMADMAVATKAAGGMQVELTELPAGTIVWLTDKAMDKVTIYDEKINEVYILPSSTGLKEVPVNMAAYYARFGTIEFIPAFSEYVELPLSWFLQPAERVVDFVATVQGLTLRERVEYKNVIELCHNIARYERVTKKTAPVDRKQYTLAMLREPIDTPIS